MQKSHKVQTSPWEDTQYRRGLRWNPAESTCARGKDARSKALVKPRQEGSRDLQKGYPSVTKGASSSAKHPSKVPFTKAWRGLHLRKASRGLEEIWKGLEGGLKGALRGLQGRFKGAWRGLEGGLKPSTLKGASRGLEGGLKGPSRGLEGGLTLKEA